MSPTTLHDAVAVVGLLVLVFDLTGLSTFIQNSFQHLQWRHVRSFSICTTLLWWNKANCIQFNSRYSKYVRFYCDKVQAHTCTHTQTHLIKLFKAMGQFFRNVMQLLFGSSIPLPTVRQRLLETILLQRATTAQIITKTQYRELDNQNISITALCPPNLTINMDILWLLTVLCSSTSLTWELGGPSFYPVVLVCSSDPPLALLLCLVEKRLWPSSHPARWERAHLAGCRIKPSWGLRL